VTLGTEGQDDDRPRTDHRAHGCGLRERVLRQLGQILGGDHKGIGVGEAGPRLVVHLGE